MGDGCNTKYSNMGNARRHYKTKHGAQTKQNLESIQNPILECPLVCHLVCPQRCPTGCHLECQLVCPLECPTGCPMHMQCPLESQISKTFLLLWMQAIKHQ